MKLFLNKNLFDHHEQKIKEGSKEDAEFARLGVYLVEGLLRDLPQDGPAGNGQKVRRWELARKIQRTMRDDTAEDCWIDMRAEDVSMIKKRIETFMPTVIVGPVFEAIEGTENGVEKMDDVARIGG